MQIFMDNLDDRCTPKVLFCCRSMFNRMNDLRIDLSGKDIRVNFKTDPSGEEIKFCPYCGTAIQGFKGEGGGNVR